jgi:hypothetical protein
MVTFQVVTSELLMDILQQVLQSLVDLIRIFGRMGNCTKLDRLNWFLSQPISAAYY